MFMHPSVDIFDCLEYGSKGSTTSNKTSSKDGLQRHLRPDYPCYSKIELGILSTFCSTPHLLQHLDFEAPKQYDIATLRCSYPTLTYSTLPRFQVARLVAQPVNQSVSLPGPLHINLDTPALTFRINTPTLVHGQYRAS